MFSQACVCSLLEGGVRGTPMLPDEGGYPHPSLLGGGTASFLTGGGYPNLSDWGGTPRVGPPHSVQTMGRGSPCPGPGPRTGRVPPTGTGHSPSVLATRRAVCLLRLLEGGFSCLK